MPLLPNVMRVFLENGQTRSFKYDANTTVEDVLKSLCDRLQIHESARLHFALVLEHPQGRRTHKLALLHRDEKLSKIASRPGSQHFRCLLRVTYVPSEVVSLFEVDPNAFEYYYQQCINDVVSGRYAYEMRYETCIRLCAYHMQQMALDANQPKLFSSSGKVSLKHIEKEYGLEIFLPSILLENVKRKEIRKHIRFYLKREATLAPPSSLSTTSTCTTSPSTVATANGSVLHSGNGAPPASALTSSVYARCRYMLTLHQLPSYDSSFKQDTQTDMTVRCTPYGHLMLTVAGQDSTPTLVQYSLIGGITISACDGPATRLVTITLTHESECHELCLLAEREDVDDLVLYIQGYCQLFTGQVPPCDNEEEENDEQAPPAYHGLHSVRPAGWNYAHSDDRDIGCAANDQTQRLVDFSRRLPSPTAPAPPTQNNNLEAERSSDTDTGDYAHVDEGEPTATCSNDARKESEESDMSHPRTFLRAKDSIVIRSAEYRMQLATMGEVSSSDTESMSTPSQSPCRRQQQNNAQRPSALGDERKVSQFTHRQSFGLQSPDDLPCAHITEGELQEIVSSCDVGGDTLEELLLLFPDNFCADGDITDLTQEQTAAEAPPSPPIEYRDSALTRSTTSQTSNDIFLSTVMQRLESGDTQVIDDAYRRATRETGIDSRGQRTQTPTQASPRTQNALPSTGPTSQYPSLVTDPIGFEQFVQSSIVQPPAARKTVRFDASTSGAHKIRPLIVGMNAQSSLDSVPDAKSTDEEEAVRRTSLRQFSGLENSTFAPPTVQTVELRQFSGLELLGNEHASTSQVSEAGTGVDEMSLRRHDLDYHICASGVPTPDERRKHFEHLKQVEPYITASPHRSPARCIISSPRPNDSSNVSASSSLLLMPVAGGAGIDYAEAINRIQALIENMRTATDELPSQSPRRVSLETQQQLKMALLSDSQLFASASKLLVRSATDTTAMSSGTTTAHTRLCLLSTCERAQALSDTAIALLQRATSLFRAQMLSAKVSLVLQSLLSTVEALQAASGKTLAASETKHLMRQSTTLAASLTQLIHAVRANV